MGYFLIILAFIFIILLRRRVTVLEKELSGFKKTFILEIEEEPVKQESETETFRPKQGGKPKDKLEPAKTIMPLPLLFQTIKNFEG